MGTPWRMTHQLLTTSFLDLMERFSKDSHPLHSSNSQHSGSQPRGNNPPKDQDHNLLKDLDHNLPKDSNSLLSDSPASNLPFLSVNPIKEDLSPRQPDLLNQWPLTS